MKKGFLSSTVRVFREGLKKTCAKLFSFCFRSKSFSTFGIPFGMTSLDHLIKGGNLKKSFVFTPPKSIHSTLYWQFAHHENIENEENGFFKLTRGIATATGGNLTHEGKLITTYLRPLDGKPLHQHDLFRFSTSKFFPKILNISEPVVSIAMGWQGAFYHWFYEVLPRINILEKEKIHIKKLYVEASSSFQKESLDLLGFSNDQIINTNKIAGVKSPEIIIPSIPNAPERSGCEFLRKKFIPFLKKTKPLRLYITRNDAYCRRIINEKEVFAFLQRDGFQRIEMSQLSLQEQMELFYNAEKIIAPHGAALTFLAFCEPETSLLEIFSHAYVNTCYWIVSNWRGLNYHYLFGKGEPYPDFVNPKLDPDIEVDMKTFKEAYARL